MKSIKYYQSLPDYMEGELLEKEFSSILNDMGNKGSIEYLDAICELSLRKENSSWVRYSRSRTSLYLRVLVTFEIKS